MINKFALKGNLITLYFLLLQSGHLNANEVDMNEVEAAALEMQKVSGIL